MARARIGFVISGTLQPRDLIQAFVDELTRLDHTTTNSALVKRACSINPISDEGREVLGELEDALAGFAPPYSYFGAHPGDGADFGYWPDWDSIKRDRRDGELPSGDELPDRTTAGGYFLHISDHGNTELYEWRARGWRSVWSVA